MLILVRGIIKGLVSVRQMLSFPPPNKQKITTKQTKTLTKSIVET